ncbi:restriction endonuclease subunit S [Eggerthellaceae bacterium zg-893]|nr:restriction endonuclease subunit S [Eggerthellaceae bacterium zg-893]
MSTPLNKLCELIVDCPHSTAPDEGEGYPLIRTPNIGPGYLDLTDVHRVSKETYDIRNERAVPQPMDLILAREAPAGNVGIIREGQWVCLGQRTVLIRPDQNKVDPWFLNYYLNAPRQRHRLLSNANGATVSHVNMPIIRNLPVDMPNMNAQRRIASILMAYDNLIENSRRQIALLEEAAQRLYREWFVDLCFPGHESVEIIDGLPDGWLSMPVSEYAHVIKGCSYKTENIDVEQGVPMVNLASIASWGGYKPYTERTYGGAYKAEQVLGTNDVVMALTEQTAGLAGYVARIPRYAQGSIPSMDLACLRPESGTRAYLYCTCRYGDVSRLLSLLANGTKIKHLKPEALGYTAMPVPPTELQQRFEDAVSPMFRCIDVLMEQNERLRVARDRLLPKLMSDEIEVEG